MILLPYWLLRLLPMWDYICPRCQKEVEKHSHKCPYCREHYGVPVRVPPKVLKDRKALEKYVHEKIFPRVASWQRDYLAQFFTVLFSDGFESGDFTAWTSTAGTPAIVTSPVHHGASAGQVNASGDYIEEIVAAQTIIYVRFYWQSANLPSLATNDRFTIVRLQSGTTTIAFLQWNNPASDNAQWRVSPLGGATATFTTPTPTINTWYCIEMMVKIGNGDGEARVFIDDVERDAQTALVNNAAGGVTRITLGLTTVVGTAPTATYDCVVIADAYVGPEAAVVMRGVGDGLTYVVFPGNP